MRPAFLAFLVSFIAAFLTLWIVVPPPQTLFWLIAVGAGEWSLWLGALGLVGALLAARVWRRGGASTRAVGFAAGLAVALGLTAAGFSLVPLVTTWPVARANNVRLSLGDYLWGAPGTAPGLDVTTETVPYRTVAGQTLRLDVYRAKNETTARPAVVVVHGGSWRGGTKSDFASWDRWLARSGYIVFDIEYRLTPQPNAETATDDVRAGVAWVKQNAARLNVDKARVALLGRSAGAHLALLAAYTAKSDDERARAVVALYAPTDLIWGYRNPANPAVLNTSAALRDFLGGTPETALDAYEEASPLSHVRPNTPPTLLFHGGRDALVSPRHSVFLANKLRAAGVPHQAIFLPYAQHGFDYNDHGWGAQVVRPVLLRFLRAHL